MPPKKIVTREQILDAAMEITRNSGIDAVTARSIAAALGVSTHPIFTYFDTINSIKDDVLVSARELYHEYILQGLDEKIPFLGVGHQFLILAKNEPELFKMLFFKTTPDGRKHAYDEFEFTLALVVESVMKIYNVDKHTAECYYRNLWLMSLSFATLIVTGNCTYTDEEMLLILTQTSLATYKAIKDIPGFIDGDFDKDWIFTQLSLK
ncbi:MAG: TetR/AcrR family transcriptional regulator [Ruminococcus sp.]|nr:TetR/AcrR family transcriptional regulator [Ruminococcus sp.]